MRVRVDHFWMHDSEGGPVRDARQQESGCKPSLISLALLCNRLAYEETWPILDFVRLSTLHSGVALENGFVGMFMSTYTKVWWDGGMDSAYREVRGSEQCISGGVGGLLLHCVHQNSWGKLWSRRSKVLEYLQYLEQRYSSTSSNYLCNKGPIRGSHMVAHTFLDIHRGIKA